MSAPTTIEAMPTAGTARAGWVAFMNKSSRARVFLIAGVLLLLLSLTRVITDGGDLTSSQTASITLLVTIPILLAGLADTVVRRRRA